MPPRTETRPPLSRRHFTALLSMIMALVALGIDMMLPAFAGMREYFGLSPDSTRVAQVVTMYLLGTALAQFFYGPLADRFGRKPTLYVGLAIYGGGALGAMVAPSLTVVLFFRFIWGIGAAGPRVIAVSVVRDRYTGDEMAKAMSFIMAIFILVPVLAPSVGAALAAIFPWQSVFAFGMLAAAGMAIWARVLPETLDPANRLPIDAGKIAAAVAEVATNRVTVGYTIAMTATFGAFTSYLASSERIFGEIYHRPNQFPLIFGALAATMGAAILLNSRLVDRFGTRRMVHFVVIGYAAVSTLFMILTVSVGGTPAIWALLLAMAVMLGLHGLLIPNFNTVAMLPMGHIAGTAAAMIGTVSLAGGAAIGAVIDSMLGDTVTPLMAGFSLMSTIALLWIVWAERGKLFTATATPPPADHASRTPAT
jgi:DHA1 family bicyclomycin/chloramphenicol resistance-like MFS transporter